MNRRPRVYCRTTHRLREIERIISYRYGLIPDSDDADIYLDQVACCYSQIIRKARGNPRLSDIFERLQLWCERWAPAASALLCRRVAKRVLLRPRMDNADICAARLRLSYDERTKLRITTIGAYDVDKRQRAQRYRARKLRRDRERAARIRAARGSVTRKEYLAKSLSVTQPWKKQGISRRTWERRRKQHRPRSSEGEIDANSLPSDLGYMLGDGVASDSASPLTDDAACRSGILTAVEVS
jgi:hypothetical protein